MLPVDLVGLFETHYPVRAALRATAGWTQMVAVAAWDKLLAFALVALINRHVAETLKKRPVNPLQSFTALPALHSTSCYNPICGGGTSRATIKVPPSPHHILCWTALPCMARASTISRTSMSKSPATPLRSSPGSADRANPR